MKGTGDGWLAEFDSATPVLSSLEIQAESTARQARTPKKRRLTLRIGVSLGEIAVEDGDVYGTGVNLAARLEAIAVRVVSVSPTGYTSRCAHSPGSVSTTWDRRT